MPATCSFNDLARHLRLLLRNGAPVLQAGDYPMLRQAVALIGSLTKEERDKPHLLPPSRWSRAERGSGVNVLSWESMNQLWREMASVASHFDS